VGGHTGGHGGESSIKGRQQAKEKAKTINGFNRTMGVKQFCRQSVSLKIPKLTIRGGTKDDYGGL